MLEGSVLHAASVLKSLRPCVVPSGKRRSLMVLFLVSSAGMFCSTRPVRVVSECVDDRTWSEPQSRGEAGGAILQCDSLDACALDSLGWK